MNRFLFLLILVPALLACDPPPANVPTRVSITDLASVLQGHAYVSKSEAYEALKAIPPVTRIGLTPWTQDFYARLIRENRFYSWEMLDRRDRIAHYCHTECKCISDAVIETVKKTQDWKARTDLEVYQLFIHPGSRGPVEVKGPRFQIERAYFYHVATLFVSPTRNEVSVFDPVIFNDGQIHSLAEWMPTIRDLQDLRLVAIRVETGLEQTP